MSHHQTTATARAVALRQQEIIAAEGPYHVDGTYYANAFDADRQRRRAAERMVRETARREAYNGRRAGCSTDALPRVVTWLTPRERQRVDAAGGAYFSTMHRDTLAGVRADLTAGSAEAALVSAALITAADVPVLTALVRGLPGCTVVGMVADADEARALAGTLSFGHAGLSQVVDARVPSGWQALRAAFAPGHLPRAFQRDALTAVLSDLGAPGANGNEDIPTGSLRFFRAIFSPRVTSAKLLAADLGVCPSTLMSRFFRAGLPSPKRYVATARLVWAAHLAESQALSIRAIALRLDASSPQSFGRTVRMMTGMTAAQFRTAFTGAAMLDQFRATLIAPHRDTLRAFDPLTDGSIVRARRSDAAPNASQANAQIAGRAA